MAKDLVRTRRNIQKFYQTRTQVQAISLQIQVWFLFPKIPARIRHCFYLTRLSLRLSYLLQTFRSNQQMAEAMKGVTKALSSMNKGIFAKHTTLVQDPKSK